MGRPMIPWQRYVSNVAGEINPATGMLRYSKILLTLQRQGGKTTLDLATSIHNCLLGSGDDPEVQRKRPKRRAWYTAQSGQHATAVWREMAEEFAADSSKLRGLKKNLRLSNGSEELELVNGAKFRPHPPTADSLHSKQADRNTLDEAWWWSEQQGDALIQAIVPPATTRRMTIGEQPQLWIISTEGTIESTFFNRELDAARDSPEPGTAIFDFGLPADADPDDLRTVLDWHPGRGYLIDMETLVDARSKMPIGEFARAYGNRRTGSSERLISDSAWRDGQWRDAIPDGTAICFAAAAGVDSVDTTITVTVLLQDGRTITAIPDGGHRPGTYWAPARMLELQAQFPGTPFVIDRAGPSAGLYDDADRAGVSLLPVNMQDVSSGTQVMLDGIQNPTGPTFYVKPHEAFDKAAELVTRRWVSDGAYLLGRRRSLGSISSLESGVLSAWGVTHLPTVHGLQVF